MKPFMLFYNAGYKKSSSRIAKTLLLFFTLFINCAIAFSQNPFVSTAPVQDGSISASEYGNCNSGAWYMAWDNTNLYIAKTGGATAEPDVIYFNLNPNSSANGGVASGSNGQTTGKNDFNVTPALPFLANARVYWTSSYAEVTINTGSGWGSGVTSGLVFNTGSTNREIKIPWTVLNNGGGIPAAFNWLGTASSTGSPGYIYDAFPAANYSGNGTGTPTYYYYQTVDATASASATNPFNSNRESFTNYNNTSYSYTNTLPATLFDFTIGNTSGNGTTNLQSSITVERDLIVKNGTLDVTNGTGCTLSMSNTAGNIFIFTTSGGHIYGTDGGVGNDLTLQINTGASITLGGDAALSNTDDHKFLNVTVQSGATLALARGLLVRYGSFTVEGTLQINTHGYIEGGASDAVAASYSSGNLIYATAGAYTSTDYEWPGSNAPVNISIETTGTAVTLNNSKTISGALTLSSGTLLNLNSKSLQIDGTLTGTGTLSGSSSSNLTINGASATLYFTSGAATLNNLTLGSSCSATLQSALAIASTGNLSIANGGLLTTNNFLTLKSDINGTAAIAANSSGSTYITDNVTVERYIPANSERAWRLLSIPTQTTQTINASWQEGHTRGVVGATGLGTIITAGAANTNWLADGFDTAQVAGSMLTYNQGTNAWDEVPSTYNSIATTSGYFLYIRGDRTQGPSSNATPTTPTVLRTTGTLYQGTQPGISVPGNSFGLIGNTYASTIDFTGLTMDAGINNEFYVWDPKLLNTPPSLGAYVTFSSVNSWIPVPGVAGAGNYGNNPNSLIQSGQAFFVHASSGGNITFTENSKVSGSTTVFRPTTPLDASARLTANLFRIPNNPASLADGNVAVFNSAYSDTVDGNDALKFSNAEENFTLLRSGQYLIIEARQPITTVDTLYYAMWNMLQQQYQLEFTPDDFNSGIYASLIDNFLHSQTPISLNSTTDVLFTVNSNAASSAINRFRVVFSTSAPTPLNFTSVTAQLQSNTNATITWKVNSAVNIKQYEVEYSTDGFNFIDIGAVTASQTANYSLTNANTTTGENYYRVKAIETSGNVYYSNIATITVIATSGVTVYPNPVTDNNINIQLNNLPAGVYAARLFNMNGKEISTAKFTYNGNGAPQNMYLSSMIAAGTYKLEITTAANIKYTTLIIVEHK